MSKILFSPNYWLLPSILDCSSSFASRDFLFDLSIILVENSVNELCMSLATTTSKNDFIKSNSGIDVRVALKDSGVTDESLSDETGKISPL